MEVEVEVEVVLLERKRADKRARGVGGWKTGEKQGAGIAKSLKLKYVK